MKQHSSDWQWQCYGYQWQEPLWKWFTLRWVQSGNEIGFPMQCHGEILIKSAPSALLLFHSVDKYDHPIRTRRVSVSALRPDSEFTTATLWDARRARTGAPGAGSGAQRCSSGEKHSLVLVETLSLTCCFISRCNYIALVGGGPNHRYPGTKVTMTRKWDRDCQLVSNSRWPSGTISRRGLW